MLSFLFMFVIGCDFSPPPKIIPRKPKVPKRDRNPNKKRRPDMDTGELGEGLLGAIRYEPIRPGAFEDLTVLPEINRSGHGYVDVDVSWTVNGRKLLSERDPTLGHRHFSKGDEVQATVTVQASGIEVSDNGPTITVSNTEPRFLTNPRSLTKLDGFRVRGEDPDGGRVTYSLKAGPPGLSIGENTGVCRYNPSKDAEGGNYDLTIVVTDEDGGTSDWRLQIQVSPGSESASVQAKRKSAREEAEAKRAQEEAKRSGDEEYDQDEM